ncbi:MAG: glycosyltransferase family 4 protein [Lentisphaeria bacterium]|nr:glycosyltransferase family 4 protein [Lentisphaeria bacterium]
MDQNTGKQTLHFAFVLYRYFPHGGLQKDFLRTLQEVLSRGHRVTVFLAKQEAPLPDAKNLEVILLPVSGWSNHAKMRSFSKKVLQELAKNNFDNTLMFSRLPGGDFYFAADNCLAADWSKLHHPLILKLLPRYRTFLALEKAVLQPDSKTRILALVAQQKRDYQSFYYTQDERFTILPAGIDPTCRRPDDVPAIRREVRERFRIPQEAILLIQVAAQFGVKGVDRAIEAMVEQARTDLFLLVAGGGEIEKYKAIAEKHGVVDRVIFAGASSDIPHLIAAADLMIHPARKEATGTVIVESLAVGVPVIASAACGYAPYAAAIDPQLVTPEPFVQNDLNTSLAYALDRLPGLTAQVLRPGRDLDFYRRAAVIADLLEK